MKTVKIGTKQKDVNYNFRETCFGIYVKNKKIYLTKKNNAISLIGGGIEVGETYEECLRREFLEESGCVIKTVEEFCTIDCFWVTRDRKNMESLTHIFLVKIEDKVKKPLQKGSELILVNINNAINCLELPYQRKAIELYLAKYEDVL